MTLEKNIFVPLIIDNIDVKLPENSLTFKPDSSNASTNTNLNVIAQGTDVANCHAAVDSCVRAFESWRATPPAARRALLLRLAELLRSKGPEILQIMREEIHASSQWATINLEESILMIQETAALVTSPSLAGSIPSSQDPEGHALIFVEPLGVILGIAPWNSPLILGFRACLPAIAAGNTVILKGSELSPRIHYFIVSLFREAGFPPGVCNFLLHRGTDAATVFEELIERHEVRKCNFTGSTPVGRRIASKAAAKLKPSLMELGGKNFAVVLGDADIQQAAEMVCEGAFLNNGQICMSTDTVLVAQSIFAEFRQALLSILQDPQRAPEITSLITTAAAYRVHNLVADAVAKGATAHTILGASSSWMHATPGKTLAEVPATVIEGVRRNMDISTQEAFGPLLCLVPFEVEEDAITIINACKYGLSSSIHTRSHYHALLLSKKLNVSATHINGSTVHDESTLPHGGHGDSGWGRFGGHWGLSEFVHTKTVMMKK
ncbi:putative aldehyde dehydrogenase [Mollisia scopiformis]|uniref:Putative aldehyde dehydrogenase n=1 Tax=Mollisia scopiformis TaxID=149040 RepID=A0A194X9T9_MOLSC|nr:putative aldehyde dehydrogenase [Mollisia scopiformis]KUJ16926.1 putative aldehyde dehydrogenase [Mollisia scopiformis]